ncbi:MAG: hypothetical protein LUO93_03580 [Methanomicrobiales archaeon]|nr:hypothetical protein [Methanomicrobiales archaeon]
MTLAELLDLKEIRSVDPSFAEMTEESGTRIILAEEADEARLVVDEEEIPLALALSTPAGWQITHFLFRDAPLEILERFEQTGGDIYQEERERYLSAVREYYSRELMTHVPPAVEDVTLARISLVEEILKDRWGGISKETCLDCCCGSGIGSRALHSLGMNPLSYDNDPALLSLGLRQGRLEPASTMWIDGTRATRYCRPLGYGVAFMLGEIHPFNEEMWERIVDELIMLAKEVIITTGTEREVRQVADWCRRKGHSVKVEEHFADPIYERWICQIA